MRRAFALMAIAVAAATSAVACTDVSTDPNAVVGLRFDGSAYPSIVLGDSLRDSLGTLQPLSATPLNYKGEAIEGVEVLFSSPDTVLRMLENGNVFARTLKPGNTAALVFAGVGSLQSQPDDLFIVPRADSIRPAVEADTAFIADGRAVSPEELAYTVLGDTAVNKPKMTVQSWLVSFQLRYRNAILVSTDRSVAYSCATVGTRNVLSFVDTTDGSGRASRKVCVRAPRLPEDTIFLIATARRRKAGTLPLTAETRLILRPAPPATTRIPPS